MKPVRKLFLDFFQNKGHVIVPSSSLLSDDPSVLLTTAGVQQFKKYYTGELDAQKDFNSKKVVSIQKCFRTSDIDEVGDETHLTFFEMLGNFSFGDYGKEEAIRLSYDFLTKELGIEKDRISVTVFKGSAKKGHLIPKDEESYKIWREQTGLPKNKIQFALWDNFWGPTGHQGPCGPTTEIYVDGIEVWNLVFNEYFCSGSRDDLLNNSSVATLKKLEQPGVDTGMGLERLIAILGDVDDVYQIPLLKPLLDLLPEDLSIEKKRILTDHVRGISFLINDGVRPSNKESGYILRRLIRRVITIANQTEKPNFKQLFKKAVGLYGDFYPELLKNKSKILDVFNEERAKFEKTLAKGLRELGKLEKVDATIAFKLYESFGLPFEVIKDFGGNKTGKLKLKDFDAEFKKHQEKSRAGLEKKFGGHGLLLDTGELKASDKKEIEKVTRLHTATHLLQQALRDVLGKEARQKGSDINISRARFDFSFSRKLTVEEIAKIEKIVNQKIKENLPIKFEEMPLEKAKKSGALYLLNGKYPSKVKVYYIGSSLKDAYSKELCGGPHTSRTGEIGEFKIIKEEGVGAGIRRLRATIYGR